MKKIKRNYLFIAILAVGIFARLNNFDYPLVSEETNRDFIVARHIVKYHEMPMTGPNNGTLPLVGNSPSYSYFLGLLLFVRDDLMFLVFTNILLQVTTLILLYVLVRKIFGEGTSLIAMVFFSFANIFTSASVWPWQPYVMYVFLIWSLYLLFQFYFHERFKYLVWSEILFAFAISLHMSALGLLPAYLLTIIFLLKRQGQDGYRYFLSTIVFCISIFIFFIPTFWHNALHINSSIVLSIGFDIKQRLDLLFGSLSINSLFLYLNFAFIPIYLFWQKDRNQKIVFLILLFWLVSFLVVFSILEGRFFDQHLYPVLPILVVLLSEVFNKLLSLNKPMRVIKVLMVVTLSLFLLRGSLGQINIFKFEKLKAVANITTQLSEEILTVAKKEKYSDLNFFQFKIYAPPENYWFEGNIDIADSVYWLNLEKELDYKFVKVADLGMESGFERLNSDEYIFLTCLYYSSETAEKNDCLERFMKEYPSYNILRKLLSPTYGHSFYITTRS